MVARGVRSVSLLPVARASRPCGVVPEGLRAGETPAPLIFEIGQTEPGRFRTSPGQTLRSASPSAGRRGIGPALRLAIH